MAPVLNVTLKETARRGLERLAAFRGTSANELAAKALASFVAHEMAIVKRIKRGMKDVKEGRTVPHAQVMREFKEKVAAKRKEERQKARYPRPR